MAAQYLIDTSAAIKYLNQTLAPTGIAFIDSFINNDCTISFISEIEFHFCNPFISPTINLINFTTNKSRWTT
jgi:hypothetical protein